MSQPQDGRAPAEQPLASQLARALTLPAAERAAWLAQLTSTNPELAELVGRVLAAQTTPEAPTTQRSGAPPRDFHDPLSEPAPGPLLTEGAVLGGHRLL